MSAIEHPAAKSGKITFCSGPVKMSADSAMKCTPQNTMNSASGRAAASSRELEGVAGDIGKLDDLVALVVMTQDEEPVAQSRSPAGPAPQGLGRRPAADRPDTPHPARIVGSDLTPENEERERRPGTEADVGWSSRKFKRTHHRQWGRFVTRCGLR